MSTQTYWRGLFGASLLLLGGCEHFQYDESNVFVGGISRFHQALLEKSVHMERFVEKKITRLDYYIGSKSERKIVDTAISVGSVKQSELRNSPFQTSVYWMNLLLADEELADFVAHIYNEKKPELAELERSPFYQELQQFQTLSGFENPDIAEKWFVLGYRMIYHTDKDFVTQDGHCKAGSLNNSLLINCLPAKSKRLMTQYVNHVNSLK